MLERDVEREKRKAAKYVDMARKIEREWRDENAMNSSLLERVRGLKEEVLELQPIGG